jgi:hypothetical protein
MQVSDPLDISMLCGEEWSSQLERLDELIAAESQPSTTTGKRARLERALEGNRLYQESLRAAIDRLEEHIERCEKSQKVLIESAQFFKKYPINPKTILALPPIVDMDGLEPPPNPELAAIEEKRSMIPLTHEFKPWNKEEKQMLRSGVLDTSYARISKEILKKHTSSGPLGPEKKKLVCEELASISSIPDSVRFDASTIDWFDVSTDFVPTRSAQDCKRQWMHESSPLVNNE